MVIDIGRLLNIWNVFSSHVSLLSIYPIMCILPGVGTVISSATIVQYLIMFMRREPGREWFALSHSDRMSLGIVHIGLISYEFIFFWCCRLIFSTTLSCTLISLTEAIHCWLIIARLRNGLWGLVFITAIKIIHQNLL